MKYGIAIFPSKKLQDKVNSLRKRYDPRYALIPPHITLKTPFEIDDSKITDLINQIKTVAEESEPIQIRVDKVSSFNPVNNVVYLKIEPKDQLTALHERLGTCDIEDTEEYSFVPHITIGQELSDEEHNDVLGSLKMQDFNHEELVDRFQLLYELDNGVWTVYETFHLGKKN
ncbi:YjcG family protein [Scopulibacillus cellulosilyticus]|uniref:Putative phosphoesterase ACFQRG_14175 n=1 Tax=Scopulibacillus cellulosilyticus TaxID=2665665 RepID=A0ABW2PXL1_9BACL